MPFHTTPSITYTLLTHPAEVDLIKKLGEYPELIATAARERAVQMVAHYVYELAGLFHTAYNQCRILGVEPDLQQARLALVLAVGEQDDDRRDLLGAVGAGGRDGREIDISFARAQNPVSISKQNDFYDKFCKSKKVHIPFSILHHYVRVPHFHVFLEKQQACFKSEH